MNKKADEYGYRGTGLEASGGGGGGISPRGLRTFDSLRNPVYRLYFGASTGHFFSMNMQMVVRSLLIYRLTGSGAILGTMSLAHAIPMLLLSLLGGAIADRVQKKNVLLVGQVSSAVVSLVVAVALTLGYLSIENPGSWWLLIVAALLQGVVMGLMMPSNIAIVPEIVNEEQVMNAMALNNLGMNTFRLLAPALAGFLVDAFDFDVVYYTASAMFLMSAGFIFFMPRTSAVNVRESSTLKEIREGLQYTRHRTTILLIVVFSLFCTVFGMPFTHLLPMFTEDILKVGATGMGILLSVSGAGSLLGSLALASMPSRKRGVMMLLSGLIMSLALVGFSFSQWWYVSLVVIAFFGLGQAWQMTMGLTLLQHYVDVDYRGRVMSFQLMGFGFASLGTFFAGILSEAIGVQWSIGGLAITLVFICIMALTFLPRLRELE